MQKDPVRLLESRAAKEPFRRFMGLEVLTVEPGKARVALEFRPEFENIFGMMHGGAVFSLLDEAFQLACNAHGQVAVALQLSIHYLAPADPGSRLVAEVTESHATRKTALYEARVWQESDGRLISQAQALAYRKGAPLPFDINGDLIK